MIERWNRWWFPASRGLDLAVCRILVTGAQLFVFMPFFMATPSEHLALIERGEGFDAPQWMIRVLEAVLPLDVKAWAGAVQGVYALTVAAGLLTLVGLRTRLSAMAFAIGTWFLVSHDGSYGEIHHPEIVLSFFLLFLALSPSGLRLSVDAVLRRRGDDREGSTDSAVWPLKLTGVILAWSYFSNAVAKLIYSGLEWMNGYTLQQYLLTSSLQWDRPLGFWLAQQHGLCVALSVGTIAFELLFPFVLFVRRTRPFLLLAGIAFHVLIYLAMNAAFFQNILLYAVFIDFEDLARRWRSANPVAVPRAA